MKTLKELYELLWEQIKDKEKFGSGLCFELTLMANFQIITENEEAKIKCDIFNNMPVWFNGVYGWPLTPEGTTERKHFVQRRIKELT